MDENNQVMYEDRRIIYMQSDSGGNYISIVMNQVQKEAIREGLIDVNQILNVERLIYNPENPGDALTFSGVKNLFSANYSSAL